MSQKSTPKSKTRLEEQRVSPPQAEYIESRHFGQIPAILFRLLVCNTSMKFIQHEKREVVRGEIIPMSTAVINMPVEVSGWTPEEESIRWTRQVDGKYTKSGNLSADTPAVRIFEIDEDYKTNPYAVCAGQKLWPQEEAVALVEGKIAEGSYQAWRYEIRPELSSAGPPPVPAMAPSESPALRLC